MTLPVRNWLSPFYLGACLLLGGSAQGIWSNALLQLAGLAVIGLALKDGVRVHATAVRTLLAMIACLGALMALQLVPLPPWLWSALPGRAMIAEGDKLLFLGNVWRPISLAPYETLATIPTLIPPIAMVVAVAMLASRSGERITAALAVAATAGLALGAVQLAGGGDARWYVYPQSNVGVPTGFFANGNHMAALLLCLLPFAGALAEQSSVEARDRHSRWASIAIASGLALVALAGLALNRSLFGLAMIVPVGVASLLIGFRHRIGRRGRLAIAGLSLLLAVSAVGLTGWRNGVGPRGEAAVSVATRAEMARHSWQAAVATFPAGTGAGTFSSIYPTTEDASRVNFVFVNHAHNDYLEWAVEGGLAGILLLAWFILWWASAALDMIRDRRSDGFALAGATVGVILLVHSMIDFPLRTAALAALFALATGLMLTSRRLPKQRADLRPVRHLAID